MKVSKQDYQQMVSDTSIPSPLWKDMINAFLFGGGLCLIAECWRQFLLAHGVGVDLSGTLVSVTMIALGVLLTALGVYDSIAKVAGAGTLIPITGFANGVASPIIEFKPEGYILGIGTKFFAVAGPVISWGAIGSVIYGLVYWSVGRFF